MTTRSGWLGTLGLAALLASGAMAPEAMAKAGCGVLCRDEVRSCLRDVPRARRFCRRAGAPARLCAKVAVSMRRQCRQLVRQCTAAPLEDAICASPSGAFLGS
jgi:hypothetical protein